MKLLVLSILVSIYVYSSNQSVINQEDTVSRHRRANEITNKVVIIGAGISGLAAGNYFVKNGFTDFVILEATKTIGGRIQTMKFQKSFIEIGAQWMHGTKNNPVYDIAASIKAVDSSANVADTMFYATQDGKRLGETLVEQIANDIEDIFDQIEDKVDEDNLNQSIGGLLDDAYPSLEQKYESKLNPEIIKGIFKATTNNERSDSACDDLYQLGTNDNFQVLGGNLYCKTKNGYSQITGHLASKLPKNSIKFNQVVQQIDWSGSNVVITVYDSVKKTRTNYTTNKVLSTVSLGYLKQNHNQLFKPKLPIDKISSIEKLGFGCVNKIFVVFNRDFKTNFEGLQLIWRDDVPFELVKSKQKWKLDNNQFYKAFDNFDKLPNHKNILLGFTVGKHAEYIEKLSDACILDVITELIERFFPTAKLPKPIRIIRSKWNSSAYAKGSYSFVKVGSSFDDMNTLARTVDKKLFFSGEATINQYYGTVHGAYKSGFDRAKEILASF